MKTAGLKDIRRGAKRAKTASQMRLTELGALLVCGVAFGAGVALGAAIVGSRVQQQRGDKERSRGIEEARRVKPPEPRTSSPALEMRRCPPDENWIVTCPNGGALPWDYQP